MNAFKASTTVTLPAGHDPAVEYHSSGWAVDCHCQDCHLFCEHTLREAVAERFLREDDR